MSPFDIFSFLFALIWIPCSLWFFWSCIDSMDSIKKAIVETIQQERLEQAQPIYIQAGPEMSAEELARLMEKAEALRQTS